jgi:hypothetical protein
MWHQIHVFLHDLRWVFLIIALGMMAWAAALLMRAFRELQDNRGGRSARPAKRFSVSTEALARSKTSPMASPAEERARSLGGDEPRVVSSAAQQDLLSQLPDDAYIPAGAPEPTLPAPGVDDAHQPTRRLSESRDSNYGIDAKARTRMDLHRDQVPGLGPVAVGERPAADPLQRERRATEIMPVAEAAPAEAPVESPASAVTVRGTATDEDLLRRATRMEELGFHVGIVTDRLRQDPAQVSEEEKRRLHATLGALEQSAPATDDAPATVTRADRDRKDLADVLSKLDKALEEAFGPDVDVQTPDSASPEADTQAVPPEPPTTLLAGTTAQPATERAEAHPAVTATDKTKTTERKSARDGKKNRRLPDWARSDSFDEDQDGEQGKGTQLDIFKPG